jgi:hypothetical protein
MNLISRNLAPFPRGLTPALLVLVYGICLYLLAYHVIREEFGLLLMLYSICFLISMIFYFKYEEWGFSFGKLLLAALCFRLLFLFSIPQMSDDYFRYFFDGHLIAHGINPYFFTPDIAMEMLPSDREGFMGGIVYWHELKKLLHDIPAFASGNFLFNHGWGGICHGVGCPSEAVVDFV